MEDSAPSFKNIEDFISSINATKKISDKKRLVDALITDVKSNPNKIKSPENINKLPDLLNTLIINLNENNNNFVVSELNLIQNLTDNLNSNESYIKFGQKALPKLLNKFYLQNPKIDSKLINVFKKFNSAKILEVKDYFQYADNIPLDQEDTCRKPIIDFLFKEAENNKAIKLSDVPKSLVDVLKDNKNDEKLNN